MPAAAVSPDLLKRELVRELLAERIAAEFAGSSLAWAEANATVVLPTEGRRPFRAYDYQARLLEDRSPRRLVLKARQVGISNVVAIEALHRALTRPDSTELFVSRNQEAASVLIRYCQHTLNSMRQDVSVRRQSLSHLTFENGSQIISLPATPSTGRSIAATDVYLDEFGFSPFDSLIYDSVLGTIATGGSLTVLSTPNGRANLFFRLWSGLEGGEWSRHAIHWSDCPRYDAAWAEATRASMTRQSFAQEYDLDFVTSGDAVFEAEDLARCKVDHNPDPDGCEEFINAWDIGRRRDHTVGITIGRRGEVWHVVEYARMLEPYPVIQARIDARHALRPATTVVESNGVGDPVLENLTVAAEPFTTTARTKLQAIQSLQLLIQQGRFKHAEPQLDRELSLYQWRDDDLVQDSVMAAAIAAATTLDPDRAYAQVFGKSGQIGVTRAPVKPTTLITDFGQLQDLVDALKDQQRAPSQRRPEPRERGATRERGWQ